MLLCALLPSALLPVLVAASSPSARVGWTELDLRGSKPDAPSIKVALWYPTSAAARTVPMGPFAVNAAIGADPAPAIKGLILVSHGQGGTELGHGRIAEALASGGYLVAALRHPGDNWQESSLLEQPAGAYWSERPRQVSRVLDALLDAPAWKDRIPRDAKGPRIGAVGHSAGGYTVVALAGGEPDLARLLAHCRDEMKEDPLFCSTGKPIAPGTKLPEPRSVADPRVRAVAALAPVGVLFTAKSLASIRMPMLVYAGEKDRWLVPRFHAEWITRHAPTAEYHPVPDAWHFAFMDTPSMPLPTADGDIGADPPGFDRADFLEKLGTELTAFFDRALR